MDLLEYRLNLFHDAMAHKEPERVPVLSNIWSWKITDAGYKLSEVLYDFGLMKENVLSFQEKYNFDCLYETNMRNPLMISRALGGTNYIVDDEKGALTYLDQCFMEDSEYDELIENPAKYLWTKYLGRKYPGITPDKVKAGIMEMGQYMAYLGDVGATLVQEYKVPGYQENSPLPMVESLGCGMRGLKNLSIDMRRRPDKVVAALEAMDAYMLPIKGLYATAYDGPSKTSVFDVGTVFLSHTLMNTKAFEKAYLPYLKEMIAWAETFHKTCALFLEGENSRFYDYFNDFPKNMFNLYLEQDDLVEAKKKIGDNCCITGGFPTSLLAEGTPEECADYTRQLIDTLGEGGGYILTTAKMITYKNDCRAENLKAINDAALSYKKQ